MAFANYTAFRERVLAFITGDEPGSSTAISPATVDTLIQLGEARVYYGDEDTPGLRSKEMLVQLADLGPNIVIAGSLWTIPTDCLELREIYLNGEAPIEIAPLDRVRRLLEIGGGGTAYLAAWRGDNSLLLYPDATNAALRGSYYKRPVPLVDDWDDGGPLVNKYPELFIYAALAESAPFIGEDARLPMWIAMYKSWMKAAQRSEGMRVYNGSPLRMRNR